MCSVLGNQADAVIRWKLLEYFLVYKLCDSLDILIGLQRDTPYSKSNQRATGFLRHSALKRFAKLLFPISSAFFFLSDIVGLIRPFTTSQNLCWFEIYVLVSALITSAACLFPE